MHHRIFTFLLLLILSGITSAINAQTTVGWGEWEKIYSDDYILVELQIFHSENSCDDEGRQYKYRSRVTGQYRSYPFFVNWKMNYFDCNGVLAYQQNYIDVWRVGGGGAFGIIYESLDNRFTASAILEPYYEATASKTKKYASGYMSKAYSLKPDCIDFGNKKGSTTLTVEGKYLGPEAQWCWYKDACKGRPIGRGKTIEVKPYETTTYFVRAEGEGFATSCIQTTIVVKKIVLKDSVVIVQRTEEKPDEPEPEPVVVTYPPDSSIAASAIIGPKTICKGDSTILRVYKGHLGRDAQWVWYSDECKSKPLGKGDSIFVSPTKKTTYYVRAEFGNCETKTVRFKINVQEKSNIVYSILYKGKPEICQGQKVELEVDNYIADFDGVWNWYSDSCNCEIVATGAFVEFYPTRTTTYYLRREGICNVFEGTSFTIHVNKKSDITNARIVVPDTIFMKENTTIKVKGGMLGAGANWLWYLDSVVDYKYLGKGDSVKINIRKPHRILVKAAGQCSETPTIEMKVIPYKRPGSSFWKRNAYIRKLIYLNSDH